MFVSLTSVSSSSALKWAVGSWSLFIAENFILSENRTELIQHLGDDNYHLLYGTCSTTAVASIIYAYRYKVRGVGPLAFGVSSLHGAIPMSSRIASFFFHAVGLVMASQAIPTLQIPVHYYTLVEPLSKDPSSFIDLNSTPTTGKWKIRCPFDFTDKYSQTAATTSVQKDDHIKGLDRITRHPGLWAFAFVGLGNALLIRTIPTQMWCSMPLAVALVGGYHTDSRYRRGLGGYLSPSLDAQTSSIPFGALFSGKQGDLTTVLKSIWNDELKGLNATLGVGASALWVLKRAR